MKKAWFLCFSRSLLITYIIYRYKEINTIFVLTKFVVPSFVSFTCEGEKRISPGWTT